MRLWRIIMWVKLWRFALQRLARCQKVSLERAVLIEKARRKLEQIEWDRVDGVSDSSRAFYPTEERYQKYRKEIST